MSKRIFHYTVRDRLDSILKEGIRVATANVPPGVTPVVWLSVDPFWSQTANKAMMRNGVPVALDRIGTKENGGGLLRIEVPEAVAPYTWNDYKRMANDPACADLAKTARIAGENPRDWRVSFEPIPPRSFLAVEMMNERDQWAQIVAPDG